jgi:thioester reductase-like protein
VSAPISNQDFGYQTESQTSNSNHTRKRIFWRVEGSLLNLSAVRPVAFFTWNSQRFSERWLRRGGLALFALIRPLLFAFDRIFATRVLHTLLRGISQDRLDLLGEEYFTYYLKPRLKPEGIARLKEVIARGDDVILVSQGLDHVMRPLAQYLRINWLIANRLEFRDGLATGRLLSPVIRPRQVLARIVGSNPDGRISPGKLARKLGFTRKRKKLEESILPTKRLVPQFGKPTVIFEPHQRLDTLSIRRGFAGRKIMLIGFTGFIGKVWLVKVLKDLPEVSKVYLLIRRQRSLMADRRFEKVVEESPLFESLHDLYNEEFGKFLAEKIEVVEGDISRPDLGIEADKLRDLQAELDLVINSSGLTDFNPDLRQALAINIDGTVNLLDFLNRCDHAALLHLSTSYVVGFRDGRIAEKLIPNYFPSSNGSEIAEFDTEREYEELRKLVTEIEARSESEEVNRLLRQQVMSKVGNARKSLSEPEIEAQIRKQRQRWVRNELTEAGMARANQYGWPNTYTFTKSIAESLIALRGRNLPISVVRPSIVETSTHDPFEGWNEGVNTSAPISYLLGTLFRQLPSNGKKCLDIIPVDLVCRGMILIAAALIERRHEKLYQLATSGTNPCNMRRTIELTGLAHRKHYRAQDDFNQRLRAMFDSIPVSKERYLRLSAPRQKQVVQALLRIMAPLPMMRSPLVRRQRDLDKVEKLIELYEPFILHNEYIFEASNVEILSAALPPEEIEAFGYNATNIDWWDYWINIHIPALRKWSYPIIEGRPIESTARRKVQMADAGC